MKLTLINLFEILQIIWKSKYQSNIIIFIRLILYIIIANIFSLIPYIFILTRHLLLNII